MALTLIGMSNIGKSYWSKRLAAEQGFLHICCDDLILKELDAELKPYGGDLGKWMGQPYESHYREREKRYLDVETEIMLNIIDNLERNPDRKTVVDTSGSVIYLAPEVCHRLADVSVVVYLQVPQQMHEEMYQIYIRNIKPVIWDKVFECKEGETNEAALARCYRNLLTYRAKLYEKYATITLPYLEFRSGKWTTEDFLRAIYQ